MYDEFESVPDSVLDVIIVIDRGLKHFHQLRLVQTWLGNALNPEQWGWSRQHGEFMPIKTTLEPAHQVILKMILCSCKGSCSSPQCTCVKSGVTCESLCKNCEGVSCVNCEKELPTPLLDDELDGYDDQTIDEEQNEHDFLEFLIFLDYIHVMLDQQLLTAEYGGELLVALQGAELQYNIQNQSVPLTVTWTREVRQHHMDENMKVYNPSTVQVVPKYGMAEYFDTLLSAGTVLPKLSGNSLPGPSQGHNNKKRQKQERPSSPISNNQEEVEMEPHRLLNVCKGVVTCYDFDCVSIEEICDELAPQHLILLKLLHDLCHSSLLEIYKVNQHQLRWRQNVYRW
uniref:Tesmin/TSO1-like CXC domain-containing protein n=1 Tax=Timema bartmani TaxID=61472 RepID=A0A7R9I6D0_9NEOP|nr:unnamed protein product [Timema bartmani]